MNKRQKFGLFWLILLIGCIVAGCEKERWSKWQPSDYGKRWGMPGTEFMERKSIGRKDANGNAYTIGQLVLKGEDGLWYWVYPSETKRIIDLNNLCDELNKGLVN